MKTRADGKLVCRVSARMFPDRAALRKHVAKSKRYRAAYEKACREGRIDVPVGRGVSTVGRRARARRHVTVLGRPSMEPLGPWGGDTARRRFIGGGRGPLLS